MYPARRPALSKHRSGKCQLQPSGGVLRKHGHLGLVNTGPSQAWGGGRGVGGGLHTGGGSGGCYNLI